MSPIEKTCAIVGAILLLLAVLANVRINTTKSIPVGVYWLTRGAVGKGAYVMFCPPQKELFDVAKQRGYIGAGFCPGGYSYMMKRVVAADGDVVSVSEDGVHVNGKLLALSQPKERDRAGQPLPRVTTNQYTLSATEFLLMSDTSSTSFDSRYFGPIDREQIKGVIHPIFTW